MIKIDKAKLIVLLLCVVAVASWAQVGINTKNPDASAALDIKPLVGKGAVGLIIPNLSQSDITGLTSKSLADGLLVYNTSIKKFQYFSKVLSKWFILNGLSTQITTTAGINDTTSIHYGKLELSTNKSTPALVVNGTTKFNGEIDGAVRATSLHGEGAVPAGTIVMWSGSVTALPKGWALCDGTNGTPNLKGRFVVGYDPTDTDYNTVQKTGPSFTDADGTSDGTNTQDAKQVRLLITQMPSHNHTGTTSTDGNHTHKFVQKTDLSFDYKDCNTAYPIQGHPDGDLDNKVSQSDHVDLSTDGNHTHTFTSNNTGGSQSFENRPPYYVLAYIIKLDY
jgi:microcystin-dependent protein